jgi:hypothetical protein
MHGLELVKEKGQTYLLPSTHKAGEVVYSLGAGNQPLAGFDVGLRLLDLRDQLAPDKLTAEVRHTAKVNAVGGEASIAWAMSPGGPFHEIWHYPDQLRWLDGKPEERLLRWPEVLRSIRDLPVGTQCVYVKLKSSGPAFDSLRLAVYTQERPPQGSVDLTQVWTEHGVRKEHVQHLSATTSDQNFAVTAGSDVRSVAVIFSAR